MACFALAGCVTAEQRIEYLDRLSPDYVARQRMAQQCTAYGPKGSQGYAGCMLQVEQIAAQRRAAIAAEPSTPLVLDQPIRMPVTCLRTGPMVSCQ